MPLDISSSCAGKFKLVVVVVDMVFIVFAEIKSLYKRALSLSFLPFTPPSCGHFYLIWLGWWQTRCFLVKVVLNEPLDLTPNRFWITSPLCVVFVECLGIALVPNASWAYKVNSWITLMTLFAAKCIKFRHVMVKEPMRTVSLILRLLEEFYK